MTNLKFGLSILLLLAFSPFVRAQKNTKDLWPQIKKISVDQIKVNRPITLNQNTVFVFLSPECPLSKNYIPALKQIQEHYLTFSFVAVFPGVAYSKNNIKNFLKEYKIPFLAVIDRQMAITKLLKAKVTPQVIVVGTGGDLIYSGLIDDKIIELGKQKSVATKHYLADVLASVAVGKLPPYKTTEPIGCFINDF